MTDSRSPELNKPQDKPEGSDTSARLLTDAQRRGNPIGGATLSVSSTLLEASTPLQNNLVRTGYGVLDAPANFVQGASRNLGGMLKGSMEAVANPLGTIEGLGHLGKAVVSKPSIVTEAAGNFASKLVSGDMAQAGDAWGSLTAFTGITYAGFRGVAGTPHRAGVAGASSLEQSAVRTEQMLASVESRAGGVLRAAEGRLPSSLQPSPFGTAAEARIGVVPKPPVAGTPGANPLSQFTDDGAAAAARVRAGGQNPTLRMDNPADNLTLTPKPTEVSPTLRPNQPAPTLRPTEPAPTLRPTEPAPTLRPTEPAPTLRPTEPAPTLRPTEPAPTLRPTEPAPTLRPTEPAPTLRPTEPAPTLRPTEPAPTTARPNAVPDEVRPVTPGEPPATTRTTNLVPDEAVPVRPTTEPPARPTNLVPDEAAPVRPTTEPPPTRPTNVPDEAVPTRTTNVPDEVRPTVKPATTEPVINPADEVRPVRTTNEPAPNSLVDDAQPGVRNSNPVKPTEPAPVNPTEELATVRPTEPAVKPNNPLDDITPGTQRNLNNTPLDDARPVQPRTTTTNNPLDDVRAPKPHQQELATNTTRPRADTPEPNPTVRTTPEPNPTVRTTPEPNPTVRTTPEPNPTVRTTQHVDTPDAVVQPGRPNPGTTIADDARPIKLNNTTPVPDEVRPPVKPNTPAQELRPSVRTDNPADSVPVRPTEAPRPTIADRLDRLETTPALKPTVNTVRTEAAAFDTNPNVNSYNKLADSISKLQREAATLPAAERAALTAEANATLEVARQTVLAKAVQETTNNIQGMLSQLDNIAGSVPGGIRGEAQQIIDRIRSQSQSLLGAETQRAQMIALNELKRDTAALSGLLKDAAEAQATLAGAMQKLEASHAALLDANALVRSRGTWGGALADFLNFKNDYGLRSLQLTLGAMQVARILNDMGKFGVAEWQALNASQAAPQQAEADDTDAPPKEAPAPAVPQEELRQDDNNNPINPGVDNPGAIVPGEQGALNQGKAEEIASRVSASAYLNRENAPEEFTEVVRRSNRERFSGLDLDFVYYQRAAIATPVEEAPQVVANPFRQQIKLTGAEQQEKTAHLQFDWKKTRLNADGTTSDSPFLNNPLAGFKPSKLSSVRGMGGATASSSSSNDLNSASNLVAKNYAFAVGPGAKPTGKPIITPGQEAAEKGNPDRSAGGGVATAQQPSTGAANAAAAATAQQPTAQPAQTNQSGATTQSSNGDDINLTTV